ncbi:MAG: hypothetical protein JRF20_05620 [Deltaproteobacteria bacterium]|nr:hypothetical protein [Deltaproteobacteria bacterium]MBW1938471.1 hypothetical protein [Deltaproteobacteria bacterium]MBW2081003.1 hypothetical protein [Deltaproteobacteria bacterium]MBW2350657.1 hypothetical protein [Deltaproteobacteria bacterium]
MPRRVFTVSGVVTSGGIGVVIFILDDLAPAVATRLVTINPAGANAIR